jgi:hypothetical protein
MLWLYLLSHRSNKAPDDLFKGKTIKYGEVWDHLLHELWLDNTLLMKEKAKRMGVGQDTLKRQTIRRGLKTKDG